RRSPRLHGKAETRIQREVNLLRIADCGLEIAGKPGLVIFSMRNCQATEVLCVSWRPSRLRGYLHFNPQSEIRNWQSAIVRLRKPGSCGPNARPSYQPL